MWHALEDSRCELGESPFWHPEEDSLYWVDIPGRALLRTRGDIAAAPTVERWPMPQEPGCIAPARRGGLVVALRDGIYRASHWGGALTLLAPALHDTATMRFNDGKCDARGRLWVATLNEPKTARNATLYCLDLRSGAGVSPTPRLQPMANDATTGNGLAFAEDGRTLYWADTGAHEIRAWDWDSAANVLSGGRRWRRFAHRQADTPYQGRPDGAALDAPGDYWVAMYEGAQLQRLGPDGDTRQVLALPAQCPTMPCFGGADLRTLFVTTGRKGRPADELARLPASGQVLWRRVDVAGRPVHFFED